MRALNQTRRAEESKVDNLKLHRQMYERRVRLLKEHEGMTENDLADGASGPSLSKREREVEDDA